MHSRRRRDRRFSAPYTLGITTLRAHQTIRVTPAMEAGISDHVCPIEEIVDLLN